MHQAEKLIPVVGKAEEDAGSTAAQRKSKVASSSAPKWNTSNHASPLWKRRNLSTSSAATKPVAPPRKASATRNDENSALNIPTLSRPYYGVSKPVAHSSSARLNEPTRVLQPFLRKQQHQQSGGGSPTMLLFPVSGCLSVDIWLCYSHGLPAHPVAKACVPTCVPK